MEREEGLVLETEGNISKIKTGKHNECKNCGACPGNDSAVIAARNDIGAVPGQRVIFEANESNPLKGAFVIFVLPLISVFLGAVLGGSVGELLKYPAVPCRIIGGLIAFVPVAVFIKIFDRSVGRKEKSLPVIVKIL